LAFEKSDSARARLIKTRHGTQIDENLLPTARRECLEILQEAAREFEDEGIVELLRGEREQLEGSPVLDHVYSWDRWDRRGLMLGALITFAEKLSVYQLSEEWEAWKLARDAHKSAGLCGYCGRGLSLKEPAYLGAQVYVGMEPLLWSPGYKPRICQPCYERTVLCGSCAPEWLSQERSDVVTQLCAHCERSMVSRLKRSELGNVFCSYPCKRAYYDRLHEEKKAEKRMKNAEKRKKVCEVCGEEFTATRKDAKTCSPGCRQKAYRRRKREVDQNR
jgi:hypothetical protein